MVNPTPPPSLTALQAIQAHFAIIDLSGEVRVVDCNQIANYMHGTYIGETSFYKKADAAILMRRYLETLSIPSTPKRVIEDFWNSPKTKLYTATAFTPKKIADSILNFWVGPIEESSRGNWAVLKDFLFQVICDKNLDTFDYLINYLAHMLQHPDEKPGVMIVLLGGQGTGKGVFFTLLRAIWPRTTLQISKIDQVVGRFTAALEKNYIVCMDEALFAGDRQAMDALKSVVTESFLHIEQKHQPSRTIESVHRLFAASNHQHFGNIERDDRRFFLLRVSDIYQQDTVYFSKIVQEILNPDAIKAMAYYLNHKDISNFNVRVKPRTFEQLTQKIKSLQGFDRFWYEFLCTGHMPSIESPNCWHLSAFIRTTDLLDNYKQYNRNAERYQPIQYSDITEAVRRLCPTAETNAREMIGQVPRVQRRGIRLPSIHEARQAFTNYIGSEIKWEELELPEAPLVSKDTDWADI